MYPSDFEQFVRPMMAVMAIAVGLANLIWPKNIADPSIYFRRAAASLPPFQRNRLTSVLIAREGAEGVSAAYGRCLGIATIALGGLILVRSVPLILPFLLTCLAAAIVVLLAYSQVHRASQRRIAALTRRSPLAAISPLVIAAVICSLAVTLVLAAYPLMRLEGIVVAASTLILGFVAWRVASAPALLLGDDLEFEKAVDDRLRICRANSAALLACFPAYLFVVFASVSVLGDDRSFTTGKLLVMAATLVAMTSNIVLARKPIRIA